ncbi:MAG: hypothetical protein F6K55_11770 [Moorea sp. SIO4A3]|nr:hypothetical protein [Moorena sp. SIO4A3]
MTQWACCCGMGIWLWNWHLVSDTMGMLLWNGHLARDNFPTGCAKQARRGGKSGQALWWCVTGLLATTVEYDGNPALNALLAWHI